jgi:hypothetical protein
MEREKALLPSRNETVKAGTIVHIGPDDLYEHNFTTVYIAAKDFTLQELCNYLGYREAWSYVDDEFIAKAITGGFLKQPHPSTIIELRIQDDTLRVND